MTRPVLTRSVRVTLTLLLLAASGSSAYPQTTLQIDLLDGGGPSKTRPRTLDDNPPAIFISSLPAALIVTDGPPRYETIKGTSLERVVNTTATVARYAGKR